MNETLLKEVLGAFGAMQVNVDDLPESDSTAEVAKVCARLFTEGVETLRSIVPNDRVRALARVVWDLVGHKRVLVALGPNVPTLRLPAASSPRFHPNRLWCSCAGGLRPSRDGECVCG